MSENLLHERQAPMMDAMRWSEPETQDGQEGPPTIKNHSVTHFNGYLYCFGGYDGRRNHMALILYSIKHQMWIRPQPAMEIADAWPGLPGDNAMEPVTYTGNPPSGRNGHTATLATDPDDEETGRIIIIGGWLGTGPLAASDMHVLDVSNGGHNLRWYQPTVAPGDSPGPGPCNMHSADFIPKQREVFVFRGGNGREYLNDLHALNVDDFKWRRVVTSGPTPQQRANHSSAFLEETGELFIFGGWNGVRRLNDIHILDVATSTWSCPHVGGVLPHPRAGMTLTAIRDRLYLFGGSGTSSKCFNDLQVLDRGEMAWLDVVHDESLDQPRGRYEYDQAGDSVINFGSNQRQRHEEPPEPGTHNQAGPGWRMAREDIRRGPVYANASPNPNDEEQVPSVLVYGRSPGRRAGHTATSVNRRIYIFGGSCGSDYLNDFFVLDTDPPPRAMITEPASLQLFERRIRHFFNDDEFADVTFLVEGQRVYGHKMILSIVSDCFRAMFTMGFRESEAGAEIEIPDVSYDTFLSMMEYIYTGQTRTLAPKNPEGELEMSKIVELLELADQFFLNHLVQMCESALQSCVNADTVDYLRSVAIKTNAAQLAYICEHFLRNQENP